MFALSANTMFFVSSQLKKKFLLPTFWGKNYKADIFYCFAADLNFVIVYNKNIFFPD